MCCRSGCAPGSLSKRSSQKPNPKRFRNGVRRRGDAWGYNGRDPCRPTDRDPGLEHEEILYRFLTVLRRFAACYADSATENAKRLLPNDVRVTFAENCNPDLSLCLLECPPPGEGSLQLVQVFAQRAQTGKEIDIGPPAIFSCLPLSESLFFHRSGIYICISKLTCTPI